MDQMNPTQQQIPSRHSKYEPFVWIFWVRIVQLVLTVLVIILCAYAASQSFWAIGLGFSFWTISWSMIWVPLATWGAPRLSARYRPNIIVLVFECLSWIWWLSTFAGLAAFASISSYDSVLAASVGSGYYPYMLFRRSSSHRPSSSGSSSSGSSSSAVDDAIDQYYGNIQGANAAVKAATAFAAINWALFVGTFVAIGIKVHRQRRERLQEIYQANGNPNHLNNVQNPPIATDKTAYPASTAMQV